MKTILTFAIGAMAAFSSASSGQQNTVAKARELSDNYLQKEYATYKQMALQIWDYAELGYKEVQSSNLLKKQLAENGFTVESGVAEIPTAFVASYGSGKPVIGILAEYDALPGLSQEAVPEKKPIA